MLENNLNCYNSAAESFDKKIGSLSNYDEAYGFFTASLKGSKLLDTACGPGNISRWITKHWQDFKTVTNPEQPEITLMDLSTEMLRLAKGYLPGAKTMNCSIVDFALEECSYDGIINGFGLPYLTLEEGLSHFKKVHSTLKPEGIYFLSFMNADDTKRSGNPTFTQNEHPSFSPDSTITVTYWQQDFVLAELEKLGFKLLKKWNLDYTESDGSITTDVVLVVQK